MPGMMKVRRTLVVTGGSVLLGADVNLYREKADVMKTDDGLTVGGTPFVSPYATSSPAPDTNGDISVYHKGNVARVVIRSGGTSYVLAFPTASNGTATLTVNSIP